MTEGDGPASDSRGLCRRGGGGAPRPPQGGGAGGGGPAPRAQLWG